MNLFLYLKLNGFKNTYYLTREKLNRKSKINNPNVNKSKNAYLNKLLLELYLIIFDELFLHKKYDLTLESAPISATDILHKIK